MQGSRKINHTVQAPHPTLGRHLYTYERSLSAAHTMLGLGIVSVLGWGACVYFAVGSQSWFAVGIFVFFALLGLGLIVIGYRDRADALEGPAAIAYENGLLLEAGDEYHDVPYEAIDTELLNIRTFTGQSLEIVSKAGAVYIIRNAHDFPRLYIDILFGVRRVEAENAYRFAPAAPLLRFGDEQSGQELQLFADGLGVPTHGRLPWDAVSRIENEHGTFVLHSESMPPVHVHDGVKDREVLELIVIDEVICKRQVPQMAQQLEKGEIIRFSEVKLSANSLIADETHLTWDEIEQMGERFFHSPPPPVLRQIQAPDGLPFVWLMTYFFDEDSFNSRRQLRLSS